MAQRLSCCRRSSSYWSTVRPCDSIARILRLFTFSTAWVLCHRAVAAFLIATDSLGVRSRFVTRHPQLRVWPFARFVLWIRHSLPQSQRQSQTALLRLSLPHTSIAVSFPNFCPASSKRTAICFLSFLSGCLGIVSERVFPIPEEFNETYVVKPRLLDLPCSYLGFFKLNAARHPARSGSLRSAVYFTLALSLQSSRKASQHPIYLGFSLADGFYFCGTCARRRSTIGS
jgi:hypothetical protein